MPILAQSQAEIIQQVAKISAFGLVFALWMGGVFIWTALRSKRATRVQQRLGLAEAETGEDRVLRLWKEGKEITTTVHGRERVSFLRRLEYMFHEANIQTPVPAALLNVLGVAGLFAAVTYVLTSSVVGSIGLAVMVPMLAWGYLKNRVDRQLVKFEGQFVESLELAARSLRAGHPLVGAFQLISVEMGPPVSTIFAEICQLQALGVSLENAIRKAAAASSSPDLKLFATSVVMQVKSGGNLADMMTRLALVMRDRMRLKRRVRVLTAQMTLSKRILLVLPVFLLVLMYILNPQYENLMHTTELGRKLLMLALLGLLLGGWVMNRLSVLRY